MAGQKAELHIFNNIMEPEWSRCIKFAFERKSEKIKRKLIF